MHLVEKIKQAISDCSLTLSLTDTSDEGRYTISVTAPGKSIGIVLRGRVRPDAEADELFYHILHYFQLYDECDDIIEWAEEYGLAPGDGLVLQEFGDLNDAYRDFNILIGDARYQDMQMQLSIDQAIGGAWASYQQSRQANQD